MTPFVPDVPASPQAIARRTPADQRSADVFGKALDDVGSILSAAGSAENRFAAGAGDLQSAIYERARADVALAVATAAAQRMAQALQTIFTMQV